MVAYETIGDAAPDSRYVMFSCTKGITAGAVWLLIGDGALDVSSRVADIIPEFGTNGKDVITVDQLLDAHCGLPPGAAQHRDGHVHATRSTPRAVRQMEAQLGRPGTRFEYHPTSAHWVLGEIIERLERKEHSHVRRRANLPTSRVAVI